MTAMACDAADLAKWGAYLKGHFLLTTGRHSDQFLLLARLTEYPSAVAPWADQLARQLEPYQAFTVVGPAVGGIIPAFAVASRWHDSRVLFAEKTDDGTMQFKRGFRLTPGERVVVVEDVVTTGSSVDKVIAAVNSSGGQVVAVGALVDRGQEKPHWTKWGYEAVFRFPAGSVPSWDPSECPLCQENIPLTRPKA